MCFDSSQCGNPAISFNGTSPVTVISLDEQEVKPIDQQFNVGRDVVVQELMTVVDLADPKCSSLGEPGNPVELVYATYQGELWIHDPRFVSRFSSLSSFSIFLLLTFDSTSGTLR